MTNDDANQKPTPAYARRLRSYAFFDARKTEGVQTENSIGTSLKMPARANPSPLRSSSPHRAK
jgi:hypothetical protein